MRIRGEAEANLQADIDERVSVEVSQRLRAFERNLTRQREAMSATMRKLNEVKSMQDREAKQAMEENAKEEAAKNALTEKSPKLRQM